MSGLKALPVSALRGQLFSKALKHVNSTGWNNRVLALAADEMGCSTALAGALVPGGIYSLIEHCMKTWEKQLRLDLTPESFLGLKKYQRLHKVLETRLKYQLPYLPRWSEAIYIGALPSNLPTTSTRLLSTFDTMWDLARNPIKEMSWTERQAFLTYVFSSVEQHLLKDSGDYATTWRYLEHQITQTHNYTRYLSNVSTT